MPKVVTLWGGTSSPPARLTGHVVEGTALVAGESNTNDLPWIHSFQDG